MRAALSCPIPTLSCPATQSSLRRLRKLVCGPGHPVISVGAGGSRWADERAVHPHDRWLLGRPPEAGDDGSECGAVGAAAPPYDRILGIAVLGGMMKSRTRLAALGLRQFMRQLVAK